MKPVTKFAIAIAVATAVFVQQTSANNDTRLTPTLKAILSGHKRQVFAVAFSPNGKFLMTASLEENGTRLWNTTTGELIAACDGSSPVLSPDSRLVLTISKKRTVKLWDVATGKLKLTLTGHEGDITSTSFSADGSKLATGSDDGTVKLWDTATGQTRFTLTVWRVKKLPRYRIISRAFIYGPVSVEVKFSPDQQMLLTTARGQKSPAKLWDAATGRLKVELDGHTRTGTYGQSEATGADFASFSPDGKFIVTQGAGMARLWETASGKLIQFFPEWSVLEFSPDSSWLGAMVSAGDVSLLNLETFKLQRTTDVDIEFFNQQAFSPDGRTFVTASSYKHYSASLIDLSTGRVRARIPLVTKWGFDWISLNQTDADLLSFHPGSKFLMGANHKSVRMWDVATAALAWETAEARDPAAFSADGKLLATVGKDKETVWLWNVMGH